MYRLFAYGDVLDPWKICHGKDCVGKFVEHIEDEIKCMQQPMTELTDVLKREYEVTEKCQICF